MKRSSGILTLVSICLAVAPIALAQSRQETAEVPLTSLRLRELVDVVRAAHEARTAGIPDEEVSEAVREARRRDVPPADAVIVFDESARAAREFGRVENFGAFVNEMLDRGLRGRELAAAIHREHEARGMGKPPGAGAGKGKGKGKGRPEEEH